MGGADKAEEVIQKILKIQDKCICVQGNCEKYIVEGMPLIVHDEKMKISQEQIDRNTWIKSHLSKKSIDFIEKLPKEIIYEIEGRKIYIAHYPMNENGTYKKHIKIADASENEEMFQPINADIYLYGHTHKSIYNIKNGKVYINPGALGCPENTNNAPYGILDISKEEIQYKQLNAIYNVQKVIDEIESIKFPGYKGVLRLFYNQ